MSYEHRLGWHESFLPLGPALREPVLDIDPKWLDWRDFEKGDKGRQEQAVAPTPAAPVHPSGVAPDGWKTEPPSEAGWYVVSYEDKSYTAVCVIAYWKGTKWGGHIFPDAPWKVKLTNKDYTPARQDKLWLRKATAEEIGEPA